MTKTQSCLFDFSDHTALVTGSGQGIGRVIAGALAAAGADVHGFDWAGDGDAVQGGSFTSHRVDISNAAAVASAVTALPRPPGLLVNNAGITRDHTIKNMTDDEWNQVITVNLTGAFNMIRAVAPAMTAAGYGRIVSVTSINGLRGKFGQANYAAAKAGIIGLTKTAARELGPKGVTVNAVAPGMVMTDMAETLPEQIRAAALKETVLNRLATPEDIAGAVLFLLSDAAGAITGEVIKIDAGQYI